MTQKIAQTSPDTLTKKDEKSEPLVHESYKKTTGILPENESHIRPLLEKLSSESLTKKDEKSKLKVDFLPSSETHLRPLINKLKTDSERVTVWHTAVGDAVESNTKITQAYIQKKVDEFLASGDVKNVSF